MHHLYNFVCNMYHFLKSLIKCNAMMEDLDVKTKNFHEYISSLRYTGNILLDILDCVSIVWHKFVTFAIWNKQNSLRARHFYLTNVKYFKYNSCTYFPLEYFRGSLNWLDTTTTNDRLPQPPGKYSYYAKWK